MRAFVELLRAHPQQGLTTVKAWTTYLSRPGTSIVAESGYPLSLDEPLKMVHERNPPVPRRPNADFHDHGVPFCVAAFH
ncbi:hypothetical protein ACSDR0_41375 [Streptosporangium sp. G11]|uniref:hypothetical protein n=1 Tax=Streptosporangium sp. G11 TaxID=3436926 RepID=UPI003EBA7ECF